MRIRTLVKLGLFFAVLFVLAATAALFFLRTISLDGVKTMLANQVRQATGRELTISGPFTLQLGLTPALVAQGVSLANPPGATRPAMVQVAAIELELALLPLLRQEIVVKRLVLRRPDICIEAEAKGPGNLEFIPDAKNTPPSATTAAPVTPSAPYRLILEELFISGGQLAWYDRDTKTTETVVLDSLQIRPDTATPQQYLVQIAGLARKQRIQVTGSVGVPGTLPWPIQLKAQLPGLELQVAGQIANPAAMRGLQLNVQGKASELGTLLQLVGQDAPALVKFTGPLDLTARLEDSDDQLMLRALRLNVGQADLLALHAEGEVKDLTGRPSPRLQVEVQAAQPKTLAQLAGQDFFGQGPLRLAAQVSGQGTQWTLQGMQGRLGDSDLQGELTAVFEARPKVKAKLVSTKLNLADWDPKTKPAAVAGSAAPPHAVGQGGDGRVIPNTELPLNHLPALDLDLDWQIGLLLAPPQQLSDVAFHLLASSSRLELQPFHFRLAGGSFEGQARVENTTPPKAVLQLKGRQFALDAFSQAIPLRESKSDLSLEIEGKGATVRDLLASASGTATLAMGPGRLHSKALNLAGGDLLFQVLGALNPLAARQDATQMECAAARFTLQGGVASADQGLALRTNQVDVLGSGTVDLRSERLDLGMKPQARRGVGISLSTPLAGLVRVQGTIAKPTVGVDSAGALRTAATVGAGVATGGLSVLGELLVDKATGEENPCQVALGRATKPGTPNNNQPTRLQPGKVLRQLFGR